MRTIICVMTFLFPNARLIYIFILLHDHVGHSGMTCNDKTLQVHTGIENCVDLLNLACIPACILQHLTASSKDAEGCSGLLLKTFPWLNVSSLALSLLKHVKKVHESIFLYQSGHTF